MLNDTDSRTIQLVREAQMGDDAAFTQLYQQYGVSVLRTAYLILADMGLAEDVTQEVFVQVYRKLGHFQPERLPHHRRRGHQRLLPAQRRQRRLYTSCLIPTRVQV